jgi:hypothetical protein
MFIREGSEVVRKSRGGGRWMTWGFGSNRFPKVGSLWVTRRTISPSSPPPLPLVIPRGVPPRATSSHSDYALWQLLSL